MTDADVPPERRGPLASVRRLWQAMNHDFCPEQNGWAYKLKDPIAVLGLSAVLATLCGYVVNPLAYLLAAMLWFVLIVGLAWPGIAVRSVAVSVDWGRTRVHEGDPVAVRVKISNRTPIPIAGLRVVGLGGVANALLPRIGPFGAAEVEWTTQSLARGVFPTVDGDAPAVETSMPFGVWTAHQDVDVIGRLTVWPAKIDLLGRLDVGDSRSGEDRMTDRRAGDAGDLLGVRRYRLGDSLRRVHWAQTARQRELIICERQASVSSVLRVGVDVPSEDKELEETLRATASVIDSLTRGGTAIELWIGQETAASTCERQSMFDRLAGVQSAETTVVCHGDLDLHISPHPTGQRGRDVRVTACGDAGWEAALKSSWRRACGVA